jgi:hypothetical protein
MGMFTTRPGAGRASAETAQRDGESGPKLRSTGLGLYCARRPKLRLTTEPGPKLRIYRHVTGETASRDGESGTNCAARAS